MKNILIVAILMFIIDRVNAQTWQYTSPNSAYFNYSGNKVGIGTATPTKALHVSGSGASGVEIMVEATDDGYAMMDFTSNGKVWQWSKRPSYENNAFELAYLPSVGALWQGPFLWITPNGGVGIGTTKTSDVNYKLFVETGIRTRKVTVDQATWPDYVFHPGYELPSISSVAAYIKGNNHLPDMPSADSVAKNGVDLGSNQAQLLKKIEELTLYVIQQQQQIDALKDEVKKCKK